MSVAVHALSSYGRHAQTIKNPRDIEYDALTRVTGRLRGHAPHKAGRTSADLVATLDENRRLWTLFATDLAHPDNALPSDLRARLFYLAEFTLKHTAAVLAGRASVDALIDVDVAVLRGLRNGGRHE